jgi:hypothetical protein
MSLNIIYGNDGSLNIHISKENAKKFCDVFETGYILEYNKSNKVKEFDNLLAWLKEMT